MKFIQLLLIVSSLGTSLLASDGPSQYYGEDDTLIY